LKDHTKADYDQHAKLNRGFFFLTQAVAGNMKKNGGGSIVNIGSMWAKQAIKATLSSAYTMAKAGLHALTQHLAMELAEYRIRVNAVSPAVVVTPIYGAFIDPSKIEETLQGFDGFHPIGRVAAQPT
jgi:NAD(P)-dependent dehydrogenase (short-subunit alcohol dehydrogenase family)